MRWNEPTKEEIGAEPGRPTGNWAADEIVQQRHAVQRRRKLPDDLVWRSSGTMTAGGLVGEGGCPPLVATR